VVKAATVSGNRGGDAVAAAGISLGGLARRVHAVTGAATENRKSSAYMDAHRAAAARS